MKYTLVKLHKYPPGDEVFNEILRKLIVDFSDESQQQYDIIHLDSTIGDNATFGKIPSKIAYAIKALYERHLEIIHEERKIGREQGKNLLSMLNSGEITTKDFDKR